MRDQEWVGGLDVDDDRFPARPWPVQVSYRSDVVRVVCAVRWGGRGRLVEGVGFHCGVVSGAVAEEAGCSVVVTHALACAACVWRVGGGRSVVGRAGSGGGRVLGFLPC